MINDKSGFSAVCFLDVFLLNVINLYLFRLTVPGIVGRQPGSFLEGRVGKLICAGLYNNVGAGSALGVEPPVIAGSDFKGQFFILKVIFAHVHVVAITGDIVERPGGDFDLLARIFAPDIAVLGQLFLDLDKILL